MLLKLLCDAARWYGGTNETIDRINQKFYPWRFWHTSALSLTANWIIYGA